MPSFVVCTPSHRCDSRLAEAALRAGELGVLDLGYGSDLRRARQALKRLSARANSFPGSWGVRWDTLADVGRSPRQLASLADGRWPYLILAGVVPRAEILTVVLNEARALADHVWLEVTSLEQAKQAEQAGFDGLILRGHEAGGFVSCDSSFLLLQHCAGKLQIPYWIQGGIGLDTAAAALVSGAAGVVLAEQLWLTVEAPFAADERTQWKQFDGSETATIDLGDRAFRLLCRTDRSVVQEFERLAALGGDVHHAIAERLRGAGANPGTLVPLGQDIALAKRLAGRGRTVGDVLTLIRQQVEANLQTLTTKQPLVKQGPLAKALGTTYPILQGPMTRVSDTAEFCAAVAEQGALPFLALAVMTGPETRTLLAETKKQLGERPWGVGVLGFIPGEMRQAQDAAIAETRPRYAIIAGGRPSQAAQFEKLGISTFLHVPSPGLLETFVAEGSRKFIFEGRECGGHVGPRTSFILWQQQIDVLLDAPAAAAGEFHIVFAGGIHDGLSAAMASALAARLVERGMNVGVLMGTSYLFTHEAVRCGAITEEFQRQALDCRETILLESGVGHATRCARTQFAEEFNAHKEELIRAGKSSEEIRLELELLNIGRLRIASKGHTRSTAPGEPAKGALVPIDVEEQRRAGMYMIGQVAVLRDRTLSMAELHEEVVNGCREQLERRTAAPEIRALVTLPAPRALPAADEPIAIVGMAGMFPRAGDVRQFWTNILDRLDAITEVRPERWSPELNFHDDRLARDTVYSKWGGFLDDIRFDPMQWRIPPACLKSIEPVQLMSLEVAWAAFRDAGYDHRPFPRERTSVIFGIAGPHDVGLEYSFRTMAPHFLARAKDLDSETVERLLTSLRSEMVEWTEDSFPGFLSNVVAGRIANRLDLGGTNLVVDAACAASLAAMHTGIAQLRMGWSDVVLLGTADCSNNLFTFQCFSKTHALSPRGRSRPFDESADGIALGEAVAALVLKRLSDAERDGDPIYAVIRGIGSSSDGNNRSLTAPHPPGQVLAVRRAYADAQVDPATISLIEAHGTGTSVGDRAEIQSLVTAFSGASKLKQGVAVGSIKSMIGHTKTAAGVISVVKTALALRHRVLPPTIGVEQPNQQANFKDGPFYVNTDVRPWFQELGDHPRRAGVSAFGFGGTNFHVVMEEYDRAIVPPAVHDLSPHKVELFVWRRATREALLRDLKPIVEGLRVAAPERLTELGAAAWAAERRRPKVDATCRLAIVAESGADLLTKLERAIEKLTTQGTFTDPTGIYASDEPALDPSAVCFLYPGQGSQAVGMLRDLLVIAPWGLDRFTRWNRLLEPHLGGPLTRWIYPPPGFSEEERTAHKVALSDTRVAQPALGAVELFATELLERFQLRPAMVAGHSYGEYSALHTARVIDADDLLAVSAVRGRVSAEAVSTCPGAMAAVQLGAVELQPLLDEARLNVTIANHNSPRQVVLAGTVEAITAAVDHLQSRNVRATRLAVSAPFHTPALATAAKTLGMQLSTIKLREPRCAVYSNTTGDRYPTEASAARQLLERHLVEPVVFDRQIAQMHADGARLFLEVGPGRTLTGLVGQILEGQPHVALSLEAAGRDGVTQLAHLLAATAGLGLNVQLDAWYEGRALADRSPRELLAAEAESRKLRPTDWYIGPGGVRPAKAAPASQAVSSAKVAATNKSGESVKTAAPIPAAEPAKASYSTASIPTAVTSAPAMSTPRGATVSAASPASVPSRSASSPSVAGVTPAPSVLSRPVPPPTAPVSGDSTMSVANHSIQPVSRATPALTTSAAANDCQAMIGQWIELQKAQLQVSDRFLRIQERLLFGAEDSAPALMPASAPLRLVAPVAQVAEPAPLVVPAAQVDAPAATAPATGVSMTPVTASRGAIPLPARAADNESEVRRLRPAAGSSAPAVKPSNGHTPSSKSAAAPSSNGSSKQAAPTVAAKPAPAAAPAPAATAEPAGDAPPTTEQFQEDLLRVVSERTGYPVEMLDLDLPLEAGLGIDSIKTVEVFSKLKPYHAFFQRPDQDEEAVLKVFTRLKTLRDIINLYDEHRHELYGVGGSTSTNGEASKTAASSTNGSAKPESNGHGVNRFELSSVEAEGASSEKKNHLNTTL